MASIRVRRIEITDDIRAVDTLAQPDYGSAFELSVQDATARSPEQWARANLEGAPWVVRWFLQVGWVLALGVHLGPRSSPDYVLGNRIAHSSPETIILELQSRLLTAHNTVLVQGSRVRWATFVRYKKPMARALWSVATLIHHRMVPYLLKHAVSHSRIPVPPVGDAEHGDD